MNVNYEKIERSCQNVTNVLDVIKTGEVNLTFEKNRLRCLDNVQESVDTMRANLIQFRTGYLQTISQLKASVDTLKELDNQLAETVASGGGDKISE